MFKIMERWNTFIMFFQTIMILFFFIIVMIVFFTIKSKIDDVEELVVKITKPIKFG